MSSILKFVVFIKQLVISIHTTYYFLRDFGSVHLMDTVALGEHKFHCRSHDSENTKAVVCRKFIHNALIYTLWNTKFFKPNLVPTIYNNVHSKCVLKSAHNSACPISCDWIE